jgi:hypothetical protein
MLVFIDGVEILCTLVQRFTPECVGFTSHKLPSFPFCLSPTENNVALSLGLGLKLETGKG